MGHHRPKHNTAKIPPQELWDQISSLEGQSINICINNCQLFRSLPGKGKKGNYSSNDGRCKISGEKVRSNVSICNLGHGKESR